MEPHDVLFIDEIHRLPASVEEYIYPAMEEYKIDFTLDSGLHSRVVTYALQPFTLIGATTRAGLLTAALRSRFGIVHNIRFYECDELAAILHQAVTKLGMGEVDQESLDCIAMQMYCALIAAILMYDHFGKIPTKRQMEMLQFYFMEFASYEELEEAFAEKKKG